MASRKMLRRLQKARELSLDAVAAARTAMNSLPPTLQAACRPEYLRAIDKAHGTGETDALAAVTRRMRELLVRHQTAIEKRAEEAKSPKPAAV